MSRTDLPLVLIDLSDLTVRAMSQAFLTHLDLPASAVLKRPATDLVRSDDRPRATSALQAMSRGEIDFYRAHRELQAPTQSEPLGMFWVRSFQLGDRHVALVEAAPARGGERSPLAEYLGREPAGMAVGTVNTDGVVTAISSDIRELLGIDPADLLGRPWLGAVAQPDVARLLYASRVLGHDSVGVTVRVRDGAGEWRSVCCVITSLAGTVDRVFILIPDPERDGEARVAELESHLWRIAAEVEASGILHRFGPMPDMSRLPQMNALTMRQWEVLSRIVRGERVPSIATDLHLSQSTVRNHLSEIFKRFGVHSQPELLRVLQTAGVPPTSAPS